MTWTLTLKHFTLDGTGETHGHVANVNVFLDFTVTLGLDLTHLQTDQRAKSRLVLPKCISYLSDYLSPKWHGCDHPPLLLSLHRSYT